MKFPKAKYFEMPKPRAEGRYVQVGREQVYYETYGSGKPLLLFHGGLSCIDGLRYQIEFFSKYFKVILPERTGHGHTADSPGAYTYEAMALQMAGVMRKLKLGKVRMMGYSDGANLIFWLAAKFPKFVDRFISVGGNIHYKGCEASFQKELRKQKISETKIDARHAFYSPNGETHYREVYTKCRKLWLSEPCWKKSLLHQIKAPGLVLAGDRDMIRHEHTLEIYRNLKKAELAMIPGTTHGLLKEKPKLVNSVMLEFLKQKF